MFAPSPAVRVLARLRHRGLDHELLDGVDPASCPLLAARAKQLTASSKRHCLAAGLERLARSADGPRSDGRVLPPAVAVRANRPALLELAILLRRGTPVYAQGLAMLETVLSDGTGSAYLDAGPATLARQLERIRDALTS